MKHTLKLRVEAFNPQCQCWDSLTMYCDERLPSFWGIVRWLEAVHPTPYSMFVAFHGDDIYRLGNL